MNNPIPITYSYDSSVDALLIRVENYGHAESIELNENIIMDLNKDNEFSALEILNASDVLSTTKFSLKNILAIDLRVKVTKDQIFISSVFTLTVHNKDIIKETNASTTNDLFIPVMDASLVTA
jgi:uncharacterized protein YuzE